VSEPPINTNPVIFLSEGRSGHYKQKWRNPNDEGQTTNGELVIEHSGSGLRHRRTSTLRTVHCVNGKVRSVQVKQKLR